MSNEPKVRVIVAKKGQRVTFHCCTHDLGSDSEDTWTMDDDCTEDELEYMANEYAHETKQLEWRYEVLDD